MLKYLSIALAAALVLAPAAAPAQERELVTSEEFVEKLSQPPAEGQARPRYRGLTVKPAASEVTIRILFKFGSTEVADDFSRRQLDEAGKALVSAALSGHRFEIAGHTDAVGSPTYNQKLSEARAQAVKDYLCRKYAIAAGRLATVGHGESRPVATNDTEQGRAQNRRVVFTRLD
jgi:outer membrane protein OmpA-like peptidoglycan-associated protein